jgi:predicted small secreted protein
MKFYRYGWILILLLAAFSVMACATLTGIAEKAQSAANVANTLEALAKTGQEIATQAQGIATQVSESGIMQTAQALATEFDESGLMETMQVMVTQIPGESSNIQATINAVLTQGAYGNAPSNIPVIDGQLTYFFGSPILVTYNTTFDFQYVLDFYRTEMPKYGWEDGNTTTVETSTSAKIPYQNNDQRATITLSINPVNNETIVLVNIISK